MIIRIYFVVVSVLSLAQAWTPPLSIPQRKQSRRRFSTSLLTSYRPILDFSEEEAAVDKIDRLDDAVMGGISTSTVVKVPTDDYAKWFGVCRTDGGGFAGFRTNPFQEALQVGQAQGFYLTCRLTSDDEAERRVWKMTTRDKQGRRGELLYQAPMSIQSGDKWQTIEVPFSSFAQVRGPRMVPNAPPLNTTGGIYQIGLSMSKFVMGENVTELDDFRDGFFELQIKEIGLYSADETVSEMDTTTELQVMSKEEARKDRSLILKLLLPVAKLFFSEQSQRRKSAMKILRQKRGLSRVGAILYGFRSRRAAVGPVRSLCKTLSILSMDAFRSMASVILRVSLVYPAVLVLRTFKLLSSPFRPKVGKLES